MSAVQIDTPSDHQHTNKDIIIEEKCVEEQLGELVDKVECMKIVNTNGIVSESPEKIIKHPLQNAWTLWFFKNDKSRTWEDNQRPIITVTTVEDFWSLYNHIEVASRLPPGSDYSLFKEGIFPDWEDARNQKGGRWIINLEKRRREECLDTYWLEILFFLIGEHADQHAHQVNGAVVNVRGKGDKLAIWLGDASQPDSLLRIGKMIKERLGIEPETQIGFNIHNDEKARPGSSAKRKFFV
jgi:translation initiation factor 4E